MENQTSIQEFIEKICQTGKVWALVNKDEYASLESAEYEDENENPAELICFWSSEEKANQCINQEWKNYKLDEITLVEFIENWCIGMSNDEILVGSDFDFNRNGEESDPLEIILYINDYCKKENIKIELESYESLTNLAIEIKKVLITEE